MVRLYFNLASSALALPASLVASKVVDQAAIFNLVRLSIEPSTCHYTQCKHLRNSSWRACLSLDSGSLTTLESVQHRKVSATLGHAFCHYSINAIYHVDHCLHCQHNQYSNSWHLMVCSAATCSQM